MGGSRARIGLLACAAVCIALAVGAATAAAKVGKLTYKECLTTEAESGPAGSDACSSLLTPNAGGANTGLDNPESVAVSPDGRSLYAVAGDDDAVVRFDRNRRTGKLSFAFCFTGETQTSECQTIPSATSGGADSGIDDLEGVVVAPDGKGVYVTSRGDDSVATFKRKHSGFISYVGCVSGDSNTGPLGTNACDTVASATPGGLNSGFDDPKQKELAISPDGESLYAVAEGDDSVLRFRRDPATAKLTFRDCFTGETESGPTGTGACDAIPFTASGGSASGLDAVRWVELSPDGHSLYADSDASDAIARFSRNPHNGKLEWRDCISGDDRTGPTGSDACRQIPSAAPFGTGSGLNFARALVASRKTVYSVGAVDYSLARFKRNIHTGKLTYKGCLSADTDLGPAGTGACSLTPTANAVGDNTGLSQMRDLELSADGRSIYASAQGDSSVVTFKRKPSTGAVSFARCITGDTDVGPSGSGACTAIPAAVQFGLSSGLQGVETVAISPDGRSLYGGVADDDAVARFKRARH